jgi:HEAT repeat protein
MWRINSVLRAQLESSSAATRGKAYLTFCKSNVPKYRLIRYLRRGLVDDDSIVRAIAATVCEIRRTSSLRSRLIKLTSDKDWRVRLAAYRAVAAVCGSGLKEVRMLKEGILDLHPYVAEYACKTLLDTGEASDEIQATFERLQRTVNMMA